MKTNEEQQLRKLVTQLIEELQIRIDDRADSSLPEWEREAERLGCKITSRDFLRESEVAGWGRVVDAKQTGLNANGGRICPLCGKDSGERPIRLNFYNHDKSRYFHRACAAKLKNEDGTFFAKVVYD